MGNHAAKVGDQATKATEHLRKRMTIRRRRPDQESEFSAEEIQRKFSYIPTLTEDEKEILRSSWAMISRSLNEAGGQTFLRMFESNPETRNAFPKFQGIDLMQLETSEEIYSHGTRVMGIIKITIENLDDYQTLWDCLIKLGREHFSYGALPMYLDLMGPHFVIAIRNTLGHEWYEALEYHWLALFNIIVYIMKFGWHLQRTDVQRRAQSNSAT